MSWIETTLGEECELYQPKTLSKNELKDNGKYCVYGANGIIGMHDEYNHEEPQVLITCRGATCGTINVSKPKSWINGNAMVVKPKKNNIDSNFLSNYLHFIDMSMVITGAAQPQITRQSLSPLKIKLPPLAEQKRIADILDKANEIKDKRELALAKLDELAQCTFIEMFGNTITNALGWDEKLIADIVLEKPNNGIFRKNDEYGDGLPVVWVEELFRGDFLHLDESRRVLPTPSEITKYGLNYGDLLFCRSSLKLDGIGFNNVYVGEDKKALFECHLIRIRPNLNLIDPLFANFMLRTPSSRLNIKKNAKTVTMTTIDQDGLLRTKIILPPLDLQKEFSKKLKKIIDIKRNLLEISLIDSQLSKSLQNQAFTTGFNA